MSVLRNAIVVFFLCFISCTKNRAVTEGILSMPYQKHSIQYKSIQNVADHLLSLDLYRYTDTSSLKPIVMYVHGGAWVIGDKANKLENKIKLFNGLGYIFISVNYRLSPNPSQLTNEYRVKYPDHNNDVADAVKWVMDSIGKYGGDPAKIVLLGHSAGAHLVALTGTSPLFLPLRNIPLSSIKGIASIDTEGYDVTTQSSEEIYQNAFGTDYNLQVQASPIHNLTNGSVYPRFFVAKRGTTSRIAEADQFISKMQSVGVDVSQVNGKGYDHEEINDAIGDPQDAIITPALKAFLQTCFR